jgi:AmmeMemoRadiSam system protein B
MERSPAVSGQFYPSSPAKLNAMVEEMLINVSPQRVKGAIVPHAGLMYSGYVAGAVYSHIALPEVFILMGPNHTGLGPSGSIMAEGEWIIPTGRFRVNTRIAHGLLKKTDILSPDIKAHLFEHSLEVQLPFIAARAYQEGKDNPEIVPIVLGPLDIDECRELGEAIVEVIKESGLEIVLIASTDMSHYVSDTLARQKDKKAIREILDLNPEGLFKVVREERISMCGYIPTTTLLFALKGLSSKEARLIKYMTSGEVSGDYEQVVGYAGILII